MLIYHLSLSLCLCLSRSLPLSLSLSVSLSLSLSISLALSLSLSLFLSLKLPRKGNSSLDLFYEVSFSLGCLNHRPGAPSCYLELLDKLQKWICRTVGPSLATLATSLEPLADIILVDVQLNWLNWFLVLFLEGGLFVILVDCMIFLSPFLDVTRMSMSTIPLTHWNSLPTECFPLVYDLKFIINRRLLCEGSFQRDLSCLLVAV